ncbi:hypothetical protein UFOVP706_15 [uncultured Caudovirales phage]|uniref:Uncharacterized protein n=1 Tax=uncultured Caudovirales phage TaxID=2100421 RepID=A0A6J5NLF2_9CAUD|nr:hypothetical protein UFOVP706_15 [uncultured Caudovirales phage]
MTLTELTYKRPDGSYVGLVNGLPYHLLDDPEVCPPDLWQAALGIVAVLGEPPLEPPPPAPEPLPIRPITRRQCARALFAQGMITGEEAIAMSAWAEPPAKIETIFAALPEPEQTNARIDFAAATYERSNFLLNAIMAASGSTSVEIDDFFRAAAAL